MSNRKKTPKPRAKRVKVIKVVPVEPDKHLVELEIEGAPFPLPTEPHPAEPLELDDTPVPENSWLTWLKSVWGK